MDDEEYLPLSWLAQANYCLRRAGLLLNERVWVESSDTAKGRAEHERVHTQRIEKRGDTIKMYEFTVFSDVLCLTGKCDCIEAARTPDGCRIPAVSFPVSLYPVEYKHGTVREEEEYQIQLCAQALCLEEMFHTDIPEAALFFISAHRRLPVLLTEPLRRRTKETAQALWQLRRTLTIPKAVCGPKCRRCSLKDYCLPHTKSSAQAYCDALKNEAAGTLVEEVSL